MNTDGTIQVVCTCHKCGIQRLRVTVPARTPGQDVVEWTQQTAQLCGDKHKQFSPGCTSREIDLAIPIAPDPDARVGMSAPQLPEKLSDDFMKSKGAN